MNSDPKTQEEGTEDEMTDALLDRGVGDYDCDDLVQVTNKDDGKTIFQHSNAYYTDFSSHSNLHCYTTALQKPNP